MNLRPLAVLGFGAGAAFGGLCLGALAWWLGANPLFSMPMGLAIGFGLGALYGAML